MDVEELIKCLKYIFVNCGVQKSSALSRWSLFAFPFWADIENKQVGFKVMAYRGVDSSLDRTMKALLAHGLNCFVSSVAAGASGLGSLAGGLNDISGKYGKLHGMGGVDVGGIQLSAALADSSSSENTMANAILASGKLLMYAIVRVDKVAGGHRIRLRICRDYRGNVDAKDADWSAAHIAQFHEMGDIREFTAWVNGIVFQGQSPIGNYRQ